MARYAIKLEMKKILILLTLLLLFGCGSVDGGEMAKEVCNCTEKTNTLKSGRWDARNKCIDLMDEYEQELKDHPVEEKKFNDYFPCLDTVRL
jgi:hypothetical protein